MIPVLAVDDPAAARRQLSDHFGFLPLGSGLMAFGSTQIAVVRRGAAPPGFIDLPLDHVAFQVPSADEQLRLSQAAGAVLDPGFTPNGPREIPEFWASGVRFVFFQGPEAAPFEFCARLGCSAPQTNGHSHFAIRAADLNHAESRVAALGGRRIAAHVLAGESGPVTVRFLAAGSVIFELFDEAPHAGMAAAKDWIGLLPA